MRREKLSSSFFDVVDVVDGERTHQDTQGVYVGTRRVPGDLVLTKAASLEGLAFHPLDRASRKKIGDVVRQVAKVNEAPECELRRAAILGVLEHLGRDS